MDAALRDGRADKAGHGALPNMDVEAAAHQQCVS
jgi:hypothetical protein